MISSVVLSLVVDVTYMVCVTLEGVTYTVSISVVVASWVSTTVEGLLDGELVLIGVGTGAELEVLLVSSVTGLEVKLLNVTVNVESTSELEMLLDGDIVLVGVSTGIELDELLESSVTML